MIEYMCNNCNRVFSRPFNWDKDDDTLGGCPDCGSYDVETNKNR
jgi:DNA-directed RNA polymerase subunit RPC12/RpoP